MPNLTQASNRYFELSFSRRNKQVAKIPDIHNEKLAEFVGALLGDGYLGPTSHEISVTGDKLTDSWYVKNHVSNLVVSTFGIKPSIYEQKNPKAVRCRFYSHRAIEFLVEKLGMQTGGKRYNKNVIIPSTFFNDAKLLRACLRDLFDTDGGFYRHHTHSAIVEICNYNASLLKSVKHAFDVLGFKVSAHSEGIWLFKKDLIHRFFEEVGSNNPKHYVKYDIWRSIGVVPKNEEVFDLLATRGLIV